MMNQRGHLSSETIDLLMLSSLSEQEAQSAHEHLRSCTVCKRYWDELEEDKARFEQFVFPRTVESIEQRAQSTSLWSRLQTRWAFLVPTLGAVAALFILVAMPRGAGTEDEPYLGVKGAGDGLATIEVVVQRAELGQFPVKPGSRLQPKDRIRFVVNPGAARYLLIGSRDGAGNVTVYFPYGGVQSAPVPRGRQELPGSIELDEVLGAERLVAVFSDAPVAAEALRAALTKGEALPGVRQQIIREFVKEAPGGSQP